MIILTSNHATNYQMDGHETDLVLFSLLKNLEQSHCPRKLAQPERLWASLPELDASPMYSTHICARIPHARTRGTTSWRWCRGLQVGGAGRAGGGPGHGLRPSVHVPCQLRPHVSGHPGLARSGRCL